MKLSYETSSALKILLFVLVVAGITLYFLLSPIITYKPVPFGVAAPKGQILLLENITLGNHSWENAVDLQKSLILMGSENYGNSVFLQLQTQGWCFDVVYWNGSSYFIGERCSRETAISRYLFIVTSSFYWYPESGYHLIFYKPNGKPEKYELVNFTVTYGEKSDWGAFKVAYPKD
ncbi:hypothetical protein A3L11_03065 [Thermococcus siculi]|uniref:Uncharacterized protein n=1 Tax=Thermococcus siculi TaxID=72803 RepID=A0A2Z2MWJ2_9EURY|nr:hypothetical protein [Thermococcus siculi]ASJ08260.1 hypothetical protein A3L11_03065 [Thermococcus siculi]